jgi:plastocyanin
LALGRSSPVDSVVVRPRTQFPVPISLAFTLVDPAEISAIAIATSAATPGTPHSSPADAAVKIDKFTFGPQTLTVPTETTVTWTNRDDIPHTFVSTDGAFKSKVPDTDEKFSHTFSKTGTYSYYCTIHPKMTGKIVVQ